MRKPKSSNLIPAGFLIFLALFCPGRIAYAVDFTDVPEGAQVSTIEQQVSERAVKEVEARKEPEEVIIEEEPREPEEDRKITIYVREIQITGSKTTPTAEVEALPVFEKIIAIKSAYEGEELEYKQVTEMNQKMEATFRAAGYFAIVGTAKVDLDQHVVIVQVLISRLGEVRIEGNRYSREGQLRSYLNIPAGQMLRVDKLQRGVVAMNENPDRSVKPVLVAGKEPGTTDIVLKVKDKFPLHPSFTMDNQGVNLTGKNRFGFSLRHSNLLTLDDTFVIGTVYGHRFGALYLQHLIPVNYSGTKLTYGFTHAQSNPKKEFETLGINGISQAYNFGLIQKIVNKARIQGDAKIRFDIKERITEVLSTTTVRDRLRVLGLDFNFRGVDRGGTWSAAQKLSWGLPINGDGFALTSRQGSVAFFKYNLALERKQKLPYGIIGILNADLQYTGDRLPSGEQTFLGGANTVRGYPESDFGADKSILTRAELVVPLYGIPKDWKLPYQDRSIRDQIKLIGFMDYAYGRVKDPTFTDRTSRNMLGVGGGVRLVLWRNISLDAVWGVPLHDGPITESGSSQFHFNLRTEI